MFHHLMEATFLPSFYHVLVKCWAKFQTVYFRPILVQSNVMRHKRNESKTFKLASVVIKQLKIWNTWREISIVIKVSHQRHLKLFCFTIFISTNNTVLHFETFFFYVKKWIGDFRSIFYTDFKNKVEICVSRQDFLQINKF